MFTPTAEKLMPDLTPREELVVLARALWREGYNDHLAGHITVNLGDGTLLCNPWLLTWAELRPVAGAAHRPRRPRRRGRLAGPARDPAPPRAAQAAVRRRLGAAQPPALRHRVGRPGRAAADPRPELGPRRRRRSSWSTSTRGRSTTRRAPGRAVEQMGDVVPGAAGRPRGVRARAARPAPSISGRWRSSSAASTPGTPGPPGVPVASRLPQAFIDLMARSDGEGFLGFWEAAVRAELAADPDLLD